MAMAFPCKCPVVFLMLAFLSSGFVIFAIAGSGPEPSTSPIADPSEDDIPKSEPSPQPSPHVANSPPSPPPGQSPSPSPSPPSPPSPSVPSPLGPKNSPSPAPASAPAPAPAVSPASSSLPSEEPPEESGAPDAKSTYTITWCAVRDELVDCQYYLSLLNAGEYKWSCVRKQSAMECMEAIKAKEADLISLDAGLAYIAFTNYSMKAIMGEEYCYHRKAYNAVAVVNKARCDESSGLNLVDFQGRKSCHPGYRTAAGWNFPVQFLVKTGLQKPVSDGYMQSDEAVVNAFFSETCAPSEFEGTGLCTACGNNGSCDASVSNMYQGYAGAFRCLVENIGDIAFLRSDTALRMSIDGMNAQNWSTKSVNDFMYLCPDGGCRPINDNIGGCFFGSVPANVIMTFNSQTNEKRSHIVKTLLNASWTDALYSGKNWEDHVLSASTQSLFEIRELTRSYLGDAAIVAQSVDSFQDANTSSLPSNGSHRLAGISCISLILSLVFHMLTV